MDPRLLRRWAAAGELPALGALMERGRAAPLGDLPALWTGCVWPSLITGRSPAEHGYFHYHGYDPATYDSPVQHETGYLFPPFWETLSAAGRRVAVLDVPLAPLSRGLAGIQLVDWGQHEPHGPVRSWPPELAGELLDRFGREPVGQCDYGGRGPGDVGLFRDRLLERVETRTDLYRDLLARGGWDLFFGAFTETHCVGHQCWHVHDPEHPLHDAALRREVGDPLLDVYRGVDRAVGRLVEAAGPEAGVLAVASHGMGAAFKAHFELDRILQKLEGTASPRGRLAAALYFHWKRMPSSWRVRLRPLGGRARKRLVPGARRKRRSFELHSHCGYGAIRINLEGRESAGRVAPADYEAHCEWLRDRLLELTDPDSGERLAQEVWRMADHYRRSPDDHLPDLVVEWKRDVAARSVHSPVFGTLRAVTPEALSNRTGNHRPHGGLLVGCGPGVDGAAIEGARTVSDVAPIVLAALGVAPDRGPGGVRASRDRPGRGAELISG